MIAFSVQQIRGFRDNFLHHPESVEAHRSYLQDLRAEYVLGSRTILDGLASYVHRFRLIKPIASELGSLIENLRQAV